MTMAFGLDPEKRVTVVARFPALKSYRSKASPSPLLMEKNRCGGIDLSGMTPARQSHRGLDHDNLREHYRQRPRRSRLEGHFGPALDLFQGLEGSVRRLRSKGAFTEVAPAHGSARMESSTTVKRRSPGLTVSRFPIFGR